LCVWAWGLGGGPDVPHAALITSTTSSPLSAHAEGSGVGKRTELSVNNVTSNTSLISNHSTATINITGNTINSTADARRLVGSDLVKLSSRQQPTRLAFVLELTATRDWRWEGVLWRGRLYLEVPSRLVQTGSKEGFVALLEHAEEELQCSHVILALSKERADRADVVRTFMFLGFSILPPGHQMIPNNSHNLFLACSLE